MTQTLFGAILYKPVTYKTIYILQLERVLIATAENDLFVITFPFFKNILNFSCVPHIHEETVQSMKPHQRRQLFPRQQCSVYPPYNKRNRLNFFLNYEESFSRLLYKFSWSLQDRVFEVFCFCVGISVFFFSFP